MPRSLDITAQVENGEIPRHIARWVADEIRMFEGGPVRIQLSRPKRTTKANAYLWGVVYKAIQAELIDCGTPVSAEGLHHYFKSQYLPVRIEYVMGREVILPPSTTELDQTTFSDFIERIKQDEMVLALNVHIEDPPTDLRSYRVADMT